jgi:hypothetical protein
MSAKAEGKDGGSGDNEEVEEQQQAPSEAKSVGPVGKLTGGALINKVQEYFYGDEDLARLFERFISDRSSIVDLDSDEYKLEYTAAYEEYKALFELKIGGYIENTLGVSVEEFYAALEAKSSEDEWGNEAIFAQILVGVTDFDVFAQMLREGKKGNKVSHK